MTSKRRRLELCDFAINIYYTVLCARYFLPIKIFLITSASNHREHTILPSRERVNKGTKRMNSYPLSPVVIFREKTATYKSSVTLWG